MLISNTHNYMHVHVLYLCTVCTVELLENELRNGQNVCKNSVDLLIWIYMYIIHCGLFWKVVPLTKHKRIYSTCMYMYVQDNDKTMVRRTHNCYWISRKWDGRRSIPCSCKFSQWMYSIHRLSLIPFIKLLTVALIPILVVCFKIKAIFLSPSLSLCCINDTNYVHVVYYCQWSTGSITVLYHLLTLRTDHSEIEETLVCTCRMYLVANNLHMHM